MLLDAALGFLNHLLAGEDWARARLSPFSGQTARLVLGSLTLPLEITPNGLFAVGEMDALAVVTISLPADTPLRALTDRPSLFTTARISGSAELAECLGFVFRNLRWDTESDLAHLVGDIAARRLVDGGNHLIKWHQRQAKNLALNLLEFFTEESPTVVRQKDVLAFFAEIGKLEEDLTRIEKRVASLES